MKKSVDAIFVDRDGVLNYDTGYSFKFNKDLIFHDSIAFLKQYSSRKIPIIIITNQSGIAREYFGVKDFWKFSYEMVSFYRSKGVIINDIFMCPHINDDYNNTYNRFCLCRKPKPILFTTAINKYKLNPKNCIMIGDKPTDLLPAYMMDFSMRILINRAAENLKPTRIGKKLILVNSLSQVNI
jgi:D-glycero-D-manno-heptose 1,7-bisphosphate phosphatase